MKRYYLWPLFPLGWDPLRARWLVWGWWTLEVRNWYARRNCREHIPRSQRIGTLREFLDGGNGRQQIVCDYCGTVMATFS